MCYFKIKFNDVEFIKKLDAITKIEKYSSEGESEIIFNPWIDRKSFKNTKDRDEYFEYISSKLEAIDLLPKQKYKGG